MRGALVRCSLISFRSNDGTAVMRVHPQIAMTVRHRNKNFTPTIVNIQTALTPCVYILFRFTTRWMTSGATALVIKSEWLCPYVSAVHSLFYPLQWYRWWYFKWSFRVNFFPLCTIIRSVYGYTQLMKNVTRDGSHISYHPSCLWRDGPPRLYVQTRSWLD